MAALLRNRICYIWNERTGKGNGEAVGRVLQEMLIYGRLLGLYRYDISAILSEGKHNNFNDFYEMEHIAGCLMKLATT